LMTSVCSSNSSNRLFSWPLGNSRIGVDAEETSVLTSLPFSLCRSCVISICSSFPSSLYHFFTPQCCDSLLMIGRTPILHVISTRISHQLTLKLLFSFSFEVVDDLFTASFHWEFALFSLT
jgi:hypothetical protein